MGLAQVAQTRPYPEELARLPLPTPATTKPANEVATTAERDGTYLSGADNLSEAFEAAVYRRQSIQTAVSFSSNSTTLSLRDNEGNTATATSEQFEFSFFKEVRSEELVRFRQRTGEVAEGLQGAQRKSYLEASASISAKFEFSLSISGEALGNFAGASEELIGKDKLFQLLLDFSEKLLAKADELFNDFFSALGNGSTASFEELFQKFQQQFTGGGLLDGLRGLLGEGTAPGSRGTATGSGAVQLQFNFSAKFEVQAEVTVQQSDPIILDLDGDGFELTSYTNGARFDILGNGGIQNTAFVTGGDAFLALDRNGNGTIDSGAELFGDQRGAANGYEELKKLDSNRDGVINDKDAAYGSLLLFRDNGNGITEVGELITLRDAGIAEIDLKYANVNEATSGGNRMAQLASYRRMDGTTGRAGDVILNYTV